MRLLQRPQDEQLAAALAEARRTATALDPDPWGIVSATRGASIGAALFEDLREAGAHPIGAKIGATDDAAQARLGLDRPFDAPLHSDVLVADGGRVALGGFVAPLLELEIGLRIDDGGPVAVACIEIADSRFGWSITVGHAHADYGCQGRMLFGDAPRAAADVPVVRAEARCDGRVVAEGEGAIADAIARLQFVEHHLEAVDGTAALVASGSLAVMPLTAGHWEFAFGELGTLSLEVLP